MTLKIERVEINTVMLDPANARKHNDKNLSSIKGSLTRFGQQKPIVVNSKNIIIAGNGTYEAAKKLGWDSIDIVRTELEGNEAVAFALADNRTSELAEWDDEILSKTLKALSEAEFPIEDIGFDAIDILKGNDPEKDDAIPEVQEDELGVKLGDIYQLGTHRVMCGDSTSHEDVAKLLTNTKPDLVYTDPPYGINESASKRKTRDASGLTKSNSKLPEFLDDSIDYAIKAYEICEALKIPRQVWWGANYYCHSLPQSNNWFVWDKRVEEKQKDANSDCELAWVKSKWSSVRIFRHLWKGLMKDSERGIARSHPTQKPVALAVWSFDYFKEVDVVLDLFLGSGSTLIACEKTGRKCYGMELEPHYISVIIKRWQDYTGKLAVKL